MWLLALAWVAIFPMEPYMVIDWLTLSLSQIDPRVLISLQLIFHISGMQIQQKIEHLNVRVWSRKHVRSATKQIVPWRQNGQLLDGLKIMTKLELEATFQTYTKQKESFFVYATSKTIVLYMVFHSISICYCFKKIQKK